jgi:hypothetical protein
MAMKSTKKQSDRLGWFWMACALSLLLSSPLAWGLDFDRKIAQGDDNSAQILSTLGRDRSPNDTTSKDTDQKIQVKMIKAPRSKSRRI